MIEPALEWDEGFYKMTRADFENEFLPLVRRLHDEELEERKMRRLLAKREREERHQMTMNI